MHKNDNVKSIRLYNSVLVTIGQSDADKMAETIYLSKSADFKRKYKWANNVCSYLEDKFNGDEIKSIRMGCSCKPGIKYIESVKKMFQSSDSVDDFCKIYNAAYMGQHSISHDGDTLFFSYLHCMCDCVKRVDGYISRTWCLCSLGYTKRLFDEVLDWDTDVELVESIKTGGSRCLIKVLKKEVDN